MEDKNVNNLDFLTTDETTSQTSVGQRIRELRTRRRLSIRTLAEMSSLAVNTLSLIENDKTSPSVSTLQLLSRALAVPITAFFESKAPQNRVVFSRHSKRPQAVFKSIVMENLGDGLPQGAMQPFEVTLEPKTGSGERIIVHTGYEFVYCLQGSVLYHIDGKDYLLYPGDSIAFEAHLPHCWQNTASEPARIILVLCASDVHDDPSERHFRE